MLQSLIENYGYLAVFIAAFLEGETILVMAGFAAYQGYLDLEKVILIALFGGLLGVVVITHSTIRKSGSPQVVSVTG
jgi:membrane protein DedA with SNARE-associated domain